MNTATDEFFQVEHTRCQTTEGEIELPISYFDTGQLIALFAVDAEPVRKAMRAEPLTLVTVAGKAWVALVFFQYRGTSIGPYNEVGLATFAVPEGVSPPKMTLLDLLRAPRKRRIGFYVMKLPVTTAAANAAGRQLWGFPKFVTPIDVTLDRQRFAGRVHDPDVEGDAILELNGALPLAVPCPAMELMLLSTLDGQLLRAAVDVRGKHRGGLGGSLQLSVGRGEHPMAVQMRELGLDGKRPNICIYARHASSLLHLGDPVGS